MKSVTHPSIDVFDLFTGVGGEKADVDGSSPVRH